MAYRPPSQSRYLAMTAPPPGTRHVTENDWITPVPRKLSRFGAGTSAGVDTGTGTGTSASANAGTGAGGITIITPSPLPKLSVRPTEPEKKFKEEDFPSLGTVPLSKKTWGSTESMADRMKKRIQEEEDEKYREEEAKRRKEADTKSCEFSEFVPTNIITHQNLIRRFKDEEKNVYEDDRYERDINENERYERDLEEDGYGYNYNYAEGENVYTPNYSYEENQYDEDFNQT